MAYCYLGEKHLALEVVAMIVCFGLLVWMTLDDDDSTKSVEDTEQTSTGSHMLGFILVFIGSWLVAAISVSNRVLKGIDIYSVMFFHGLVGLVIGIAYVIIDGQ